MQADIGRDPTRTHVVGSQGRRGILPSAPGRPPVMPNGVNGSPKSSAVPQKDADGKFPCPNCTKTYLHAKHLKRHMLRRKPGNPPHSSLVLTYSQTLVIGLTCVSCAMTLSPEVIFSSVTSRSARSVVVTQPEPATCPTQLRTSRSRNNKLPRLQLHRPQVPPLLRAQSWQTLLSRVLQCQTHLLLPPVGLPSLAWLMPSSPTVNQRCSVRDNPSNLAQARVEWTPAATHLGPCIMPETVR